MKKFIFCLLCLSTCLLFVGCSNFNPPNNVNEYTMDLSYNAEEKSVSGKMQLSYINQSDNTMNEVKFHLYPNAFRENSKANVVSLANSQKAYPNGKSYGNITINNVKLNDSQCQSAIEGDDQNILSVPLAEELYPDDRVNIEIEFVTVLANINHRLGYGENCINICNFYPVACVYENGEFMTDIYNSNGDPFYSQIAKYNVIFTYDNCFTLASTGEQQLEKTDTKTTAKISANGVRDFALVLSEKFNVITSQYKDTEIKYYYTTDTQPENSIKIAKQTVELFSEKIGEYPYNQLSVVETNFVHGGMEYPNLVMISDDLANYEDYQMVIVHEIVHQWWYGVVGNNQYQYGWIDEGLTEYTTALFYDYYPEYNKTSAQVVRNASTAYSTFMKVYSDVLGQVDTSMNRKLNQFATEPEYVYNTYTKGLLMFATIKDIIGEKDFFKCLSYYYKTCAYSEVKPEQLVWCFVKASGKNLENLFNAWIDGKVIIMGVE